MIAVALIMDVLIVEVLIIEVLIIEVLGSPSSKMKQRAAKSAPDNAAG
jgi:hypothetical protein